MSKSREAFKAAIVATVWCPISYINSRSIDQLHDAIDRIGKGHIEPMTAFRAFGLALRGPVEAICEWHFDGCRPIGCAIQCGPDTEPQVTGGGVGQTFEEVAPGRDSAELPFVILTVGDSYSVEYDPIAVLAWLDKVVPPGPALGPWESDPAPSPDLQADRQAGGPSITNLMTHVPPSPEDN